MTRRKYSIIAIRRYSVDGDPSREIVVKIGEPLAPGTPQGDWACPVLVEGLDPEIKYVEGIDAIQAIQSAMRHARNVLESSGLPITWMGGEPGDLGLPLPITSPVGLWFQRRLERMVEEETAQIGEIVMELHKFRTRNKGSQ
jgi:hypothetical protein